MKILITTGIFEPEAGGPATVCVGLARRLVDFGHNVTVVTYTSHIVARTRAEYPFRVVRVERRGKIVNRIRFLFAVLREIRGCDLLYSLDWFAAGLPAYIASYWHRVPMIIRVGGDYVWEQRYLESGASPVTLAAFYERKLYRRVLYLPFFWIIRWILTHVEHVVFNSDAQRTLYERYYGLKRTSTIWNPVPARTRYTGVRSHEFVFWGRRIVMKNLESLIVAFARADLPSSYTLTLIGDGPHKARLARVARDSMVADRVRFEPGIMRSAIASRVQGCRALILPSWTDISPNQVCEAYALGLPALVTKENYLPFSNQIPCMIDPASVEDMTKKIEMLADDEAYETFLRQWSNVSFSYSWEDSMRDHLALFQNIARV